MEFLNNCEYMVCFLVCFGTGDSRELPRSLFSNRERLAAGREPSRNIADHPATCPNDYKKKFTFKNFDGHLQDTKSIFLEMMSQSISRNVIVSAGALVAVTAGLNVPVLCAIGTAGVRKKS